MRLCETKQKVKGHLGCSGLDKKNLLDITDMLISFPLTFPSPMVSVRHCPTPSQQAPRQSRFQPPGLPYFIACVYSLVSLSALLCLTFYGVQYKRRPPPSLSELSPSSTNSFFLRRNPALRNSLDVTGHQETPQWVKHSLLKPIMHSWTTFISYNLKKKKKRLVLISLISTHITNCCCDVQYCSNRVFQLILDCCWCFWR